MLDGVLQIGAGVKERVQLRVPLDQRVPLVIRDLVADRVECREEILRGLNDLRNLE